MRQVVLIVLVLWFVWIVWLVWLAVRSQCRDLQPTIHESFIEEINPQLDPWYNRYTGDEERGFSTQNSL